jgi:hypothetical protein
MKRLMNVLASVSLLAAAAWAASGPLTVAVEQAKVRKKKQFFAPAVASVKFGDRVESSGKEGGWYAVTVDGEDGWLHESAVGSKAGSAKAGKWKGSDEATAEEVTLAGKGFNKDVEKAYRKGNEGVDYGAVDKMEDRELSESELLDFMKKGGTLPKGAK